SRSPSTQPIAVPSTATHTSCSRIARATRSPAPRAAHRSACSLDIAGTASARMARRRILVSASSLAVSARRICIKSLACLHDRVAKAVPRRLAQVRMDQPSTKHPLTLHAHSFEETRRRHVVHIAGRPHPIDRRLRQGPLDHSRHRFTHEALTPPAPRKRITQIHCPCSHADFDQSHERAILLGPETPGKGGSLDPDAFASAQEFLRLGDTTMWRPGHVFGNGRVASVVVKYDLRIPNR